MAEQVNAFKEEFPSIEQDNAMIDKAEKLIERNNPDRPEWLPEKFASAEELARSYAELERKVGQPQEQQAEAVEEVVDKLEEQEDAVEEKAEEVKQVMSKLGLNFSEFEKEYNDSGELSDKAYQALEDKGLPRSLVDSWIDGQKALSSAIDNQVYESVGGQEQYAQMLEWAKTNLSESDIGAFNASVDTGDSSLTRFAVQGLHARYRAGAGNNEPTLIQGETGTTSGGLFNSAAELTAAMRDPRYHNDPAYRDLVAQKLSRSDVF